MQQHGHMKTWTAGDLQAQHGVTALGIMNKECQAHNLFHSPMAELLMPRTSSNMTLHMTCLQSSPPQRQELSTSSGLPHVSLCMAAAAIRLIL